MARPRIDFDEQSDLELPRRSRRVVSYNEDNDSNVDDEEDEEDEIRPRRRARTIENDNDEENKDINDDVPKKENEDEIEDEIEEDEEEDPPTPPDNEEDYQDEGEDDDDDIVSRRKKRRLTRRKPSRKLGGSDESDFKAGSSDGDVSFSEDEDDFVEKLQEKNFVVDDEDDEGGYGYSSNSRSRKRSRKSRSRLRSHELPLKRKTRKSPELANDASEDEEDDTIQQEIQDLYDSSDHGSPVTHKLRERDTKIDYTIPPPLSKSDIAAFMAEPVQSNNGKRGKGRLTAAANKSQFRKILYPTAGPFGGSDVISLLGTNIPPKGIPIEGMNSLNPSAHLTAIGQDSDSDSSDEEERKRATNNANPSNIITSASDGKKKKNTLSDTDPLGVDMNIDFSAVGGLGNYVNQLKEMVALPLLYPELYQNFGITPPRGVLFHGPPGTGKTLMARALAASCLTAERKITFFMRKGSDCLSKWVGEAERQLRLLFEEAKNQQPSIIFFDEIDGLAPVRSLKQEQIHASIVSTLLALMDGMENRGQVIVIGATNRPDAIDPALRRPGRFDREFYFPLPDVDARKEILQIHTKKWEPPLSKEFVNKVAELTKGYGGADLRALCTEAALNSIQRKYPQIYETSDKLLVKPKSVHVNSRDFMIALDRIVPSLARQTLSGLAPLPQHIKPLLQDTLKQVVSKLDELIPIKRKKMTALEEAKYYDPTVNDKDGGFARQELLKTLENSRICKPHLLVAGSSGNGQQYLSAAILNYLEGFQIQTLDMGSTFGDPTRTPELAIVHTFIEARRHKPLIIFIPSIDIWYQVVPSSAKATLLSLLRLLNSTEQILLLGVAEAEVEELDDELRYLFGYNNSLNNVSLNNPTREMRTQYFSSLKTTLELKPSEFINDIKNRPKRKLKTLKVVTVTSDPGAKDAEKKKLKEIEYQDTKLKNILKLKLAALMDLFKNRYKRFRKPAVDENLLYHFFDPTVLENPLNNYEVFYEKLDDPNHENMIREIGTGKYFYNMDLDIIEERLWNGYYSEPKQFLKDIKMIVKDCITIGERERILKANEMLTNAQFGIDDFSTPEFLKQCKEVREREVVRQEKLLQEHEKAQKEFEVKQLENMRTLTNPLLETQDSILEPADHAMVAELESETTMVPGLAPVRDIVEVTDANAVENEVKMDVEPAAVNGVASVTKVETVESNGTSNGNQAISISQVVNEESKPNGSVETQVSKVVEVAEQNDESSSEEEPEEIFENRELLQDPRKDEFFASTLPKATDNYKLEKLEIIMARLMEIAWNERDEWDRRPTLNKIIKALQEFEAHQRIK